MSENETTKDWKLYEAGIAYNNSKKIIETAKLNTEFYEGNQWIGSEDTRLPKPVINVIKRTGSYFVASLTSSPIRAWLEPLLFENFDREKASKVPETVALVNAIDIANASLRKIFERNKFQAKIRDAVTRAVKTGDMAMHFRFDMETKPYVYAPHNVYEGDVVIDVIDGINVHYGDANIHDTQKQPYIIIAGRDTVANLKKEMKSKKEETDTVRKDNDTQNFIRHEEEVEADEDDTDKATYIIKYYKKKDKDGNTKVYMNKSTKSCVICENVDTGLSLYPIAFGNWEQISGCYHGRALATGLIPNQIFINRMWAMLMYHLQLNAFPKAIYNSSRISHWSNEIGVAIPVEDNGEPNFNINNMARFIEPAQMNPQVVQALELILSTTKDMLGITDATLGNVNPTNTSAIVAIQKSSAVPLKNQQANLYQFVEDGVLIVLDMIAHKYGKRDVAVDMKTLGETGSVVTQYDFRTLIDLPLSLDISIGEGNYYDEIAQIQTLDKLLQNNQIDLKHYLERMPDSVIPKRMELLKDVENALSMGEIPEPVDESSLGNDTSIAAPQDIETLLKAMQSQSSEEQLNTMNQIQ